MDYNTIDREPTITDIKDRISILNTDINKFATNRKSVQQWNIPNMKKPIYIKKYNSTIYDPADPKPYPIAISESWWGNSFTTNDGIDNLGTNIFMNDNKAWWIGNNIPNSGGNSYFYYILDSNSSMVVNIYCTFPSDKTVKVNGQEVQMIPTDVDGDSGVAFNGTVKLLTGKNVFEVTGITGLPTSGFVMYVYDENNNILFRSGDRGWGVSNTPVPDYNMITNTQNDVNRSNDTISDQIRSLKLLIKKISPKMDDNNSKKESLISPLLKKIQELEDTYATLVEAAKIPSYFDDKVEVTHIQATSSLKRYGWYLLFFFIFFIAFLFILKKPEAGNLDMFMLVLGLGVLIYYAYNYYEMKNRAEGNPGVFNMGWIKTLFNQSK